MRGGSGGTARGPVLCVSCVDNDGWEGVRVRGIPSRGEGAIEAMRERCTGRVLRLGLEGTKSLNARGTLMRLPRRETIEPGLGGSGTKFPVRN